MLVVIIVVVSLLYILITMVGDKAHPKNDKDEKTVWNMKAKENMYGLTFENEPKK